MLGGNYGLPAIQSALSITLVIDLQLASSGRFGTMDITQCTVHGNGQVLLV